MIDPATVNVFELDDHPLDSDYTLETLKAFRAANRRFKANLFCVPAFMTNRELQKLEPYRDWIKIFPHGFYHARKECHDVDEQKIDVLRAIADDDRWGKVFKAPRYGYGQSFLEILDVLGFAVAINTLNHLGEMPPGLRSYDRRRFELLTNDRRHCLRHCRYTTDKAYGQKVVSGKKTSIGDRFNKKYLRFLKRNRLPFAFCDELTTAASIKINIGCGPHWLPGWFNLDHKPATNDVFRWALGQPIPCQSNRADIVYTSHFLNYVEDYESFFLDVWRVLRAGKVYRLEEDLTESGYVWRRTGQTHATGLIRSEPTRQRICDALERVGFVVKQSSHDQTESGVNDVLTLHTRNRKLTQGRKIILEAKKVISIRNLARPYMDDTRAPRFGDYPYKMPGTT